jgi:hypothetical protein
MNESDLLESMFQAWYRVVVNELVQGAKYLAIVQRPETFEARTYIIRSREYYTIHSFLSQSVRLHGMAWRANGSKIAALTNFRHDTAQAILAPSLLVSFETPEICDLATAAKIAVTWRANWFENRRPPTNFRHDTAQAILEILA